MITIDPRVPSMRWTLDDAERANDAWRFSCGPAAICAVTGKTPDELRTYLPNFPGWMNPTQMQAALRAVGARIADYRLLPQSPVKPWPSFGIARVQWGGPWMRAGAPQSARYPHSHWVGSCRLKGGVQMIFDINALGFPGTDGWITVEAWERAIVPEMIAGDSKRDGTWWPTHSIELRTEAST